MYQEVFSRIQKVTPPSILQLGKDYWFEFGGATGYEAAPVVPIARVGYTFKYMEVFIGIGAEKIRDKVTPIGVFGTQLRIPIKEK